MRQFLRWTYLLSCLGTLKIFITDKTGGRSWPPVYEPPNPSRFLLPYSLRVPRDDARLAMGRNTVRVCVIESFFRIWFFNFSNLGWRYLDHGWKFWEEKFFSSFLLHIAIDIVATFEGRWIWLLSFIIKSGYKKIYCTIFWKVYIFQKYNSNISLEFHLWPIQSEQLHATMIPISIQDPARDHAPVSPRKTLDKIFQRKSFHRDACSTSGNRCKYIHRPLSLPTDGSRHAKPRISYIRIAINENKLKRKKREEKKNI